MGVGIQQFVKMIRIVLSFLLATAVVVSADDETLNQKKAGRRKPKLFYVTTASSTTTVCFVSTTTAVAACPAKKKRELLDVEFETRDLTPSSVTDLQSSGSDEEEREAKFLVYWLTTTSVSTSFSYSTTSTLGSLSCTPSGFYLSVCG